MIPESLRIARTPPTSEGRKRMDEILKRGKMIINEWKEKKEWAASSYIQLPNARTNGSNRYLNITTDGTTVLLSTMGTHDYGAGTISFPYADLAAIIEALSQIPTAPEWLND